MGFLGIIAKKFPSLVILHFSITELLDLRLWGYKVSTCEVDHSPLFKEDGEFCEYDMTDQFAVTLLPLQKLEHLYLGIFMSNRQILVQVTSAMVAVYITEMIIPTSCTVRKRSTNDA
jgi:hypothetical protein